MSEISLYKKLSEIQQNIKAPKNLYNSFGKYNYRNAESILEAFKPYEGEYNVFLIVGDAIEAVGDRIYVKATATLYDCETKENISVSAYARESVEKKGMDDSQITGTASSYARKYALNGLFLLDDTKDADTDEYANQKKAGEKESADEKKRIAIKKKIIDDICAKHKLDAKMICFGNGYDYDKMTETQLENMIASLKKKFGDD